MQNKREVKKEMSIVRVLCERWNERVENGIEPIKAKSTLEPGWAEWTTDYSGKLYCVNSLWKVGTQAWIIILSSIF